MMKAQWQSEAVVSPGFADGVLPRRGERGECYSASRLFTWNLRQAPGSEGLVSIPRTA